MALVGEIFFWTSLLVLFYAYAGYPVLMILLTRLKKRLYTPPLLLETSMLPVSLVIVAYNEEAIMEEKINNTLALTYPPEFLDIFFITDGSTDKTNDIIRLYPRIKLLTAGPRKGKTAAMNRVMEYIKTPYVIFSDANGFLNRDCIEKLMQHFTDPKVGCVAGEKKILVQSGPNGPVSKGEGLYWKYESFLKKLDSRFYSAMGAAGELLAIRTALYTPLPPDTIIEDFVQSLLVCTKGKVIRYEPGAISAETSSPGPREEMERKIRISAGAFQAMGMLGELFNIFKHPVISFQFLSHRIIRWILCPLCLPIIFLSSGYLYYIEVHNVLYGTLFLLQIIAYMAAGIGWFLALRNQTVKIFNIPFYFIFMHLCVFAGFYRFLTNKQTVLWNKPERMVPKI